MSFELNEVFLDGERVDSAAGLPDNFEIKFSTRSKGNELRLQPVRGNGRVSIDLTQAVDCRVSMGTGNSIINGVLSIKFPMNASRPTRGAFVELGHLNSFTGSASLQAPFTAGTGISIGSRNLIAPGLSTRGSNHGVYDLETGEITNTEVGSRIGHRNWFGNGVQVFNRGGVGSDSIVGFASLVNKDRSNESHVALAGSPAQVVKRGVAWTRELYFDNLDDAPRPALTIGVPTYERPASLVRLLKSVVQQALPDGSTVEVVVTDDGSQSPEWRRVWDTLDELCAVPGFKLIKLRNPAPTRGPSAGRNAAIDVGSGRYVMFLDDDDYLVDGALGPLLEALATSDADRVALRYRRGDRSRFRSPAGRHLRQDIIESMWTMLPAAAYRLDRLRETGCRYPAGVSYGEDSEFVLSYVVRAVNFATYADRDYVAIGDPVEGEAGHISKGQGAWQEFLTSIVSHVSRLADIIENADVPLYVKDRLVSNVVLNRGVIQYHLVRRIADYRNDELAQGLLNDLSRVVHRVAHPAVVERFATSVDMSAEFAAIMESDLTALRAAHEERKARKAQDE